MGQSNRNPNEAFDNRQFGESSNAGNWQGARTSTPIDTQELAADILAGSNNNSTVAVLARTIQNEIIPRLMMAHRTPAECIMTPADLPYVILESDVDQFVDLLLACDQEGALSWIGNARAKGVSIESIFLNLLAPVARKLGELWEEDEREFTEVTLGLSELHKILHLLPSLHQMQSKKAANGLSILLAPAPGDQHTLGLAMVAEFFQRDGWTVAGGTSADSENPALLIKGYKYDVVGFSLATSGGFQRLEKCITEVRKAAGSHKVCIIVGGPFFTAHPEKVSLVGADLFLEDANLAPDMVQQYVQSGLFGNAH